jgi:hypothetical protein
MELTSRPEVLSSPAALSPLPIAPHERPLPYGLTWDELRGVLPGFATAAGARAWATHQKRGLHGGPSSDIRTVTWVGPDGAERRRTLFFKEITDPARAEAEKYRFLARAGIPTARLLAAVERGEGHEVLVLELLPAIGLEPDAADELLTLAARLHSVEGAPPELFTPRPGLPAAEFDARVENALAALGDVPVSRWLRAYQDAQARVAALPVTLNHGQLFFQQIGRSAAGELVLFDLETMALLPRWTDVAGVLEALAALTGRDERHLFDVYLDALAAQPPDPTEAWRELLLVRIVSRFQCLPWLTEVTGDPHVTDSPTACAGTLARDLDELGLVRW